ncbi:MAG: universal stress protein [bacterium]
MSDWVKTIVLAVDGSPNSMRATDIALKIAKDNGSRLIVLMVVDTRAISDFSRMLEEGAKLSHAEEELYVTATKVIEDIKKLAKKDGLDVDTIIRKGLPHIEIVIFASEIGADLIVIGKGGRYGASRQIMGTITERVIEDADCSVLVVR